VYGVDGKLVRELPLAGSVAVWDLTGLAGAPVTKGCYIVKAAAGRQTASGSFIYSR
jgi:hypothetical protein